MIELKELRKIYRHLPEGRAALDGVTLRIAAGEYVAVTGASGSGKTVLLNLLALLERPDGGALLFDGAPVGGVSEGVRQRLRVANIGYIFQSVQFAPGLNVFENVALGLPADVAPGERQRKVAALLDRFDLTSRATQAPQHLPRGLQQCVSVARACISAPRLLLADEPTANLDPAQAAAVMRLLRTMHEEGSTIVLATHTPACAAHAPRAATLQDGRIVADAQRAPLGNR